MSHYLPYPTYVDSRVQWIGKMPSHWNVSPLKSLVSGEDGTLFIDGDWIETRHLSDKGVRYITTGNVGEGSYKEQGAGYISPATFDELRCTEVLPGDFLISRLNTPIGRCCVVPDLGTKVVVSVDVVICRLSSRVDKQFLKFRLSALDYFHETEILASGATMQRISRTELGNIRLALPPFSEQGAIAKQLDREISRIDALISKKTKFIDLLNKKRQALITHAVTKGLNPTVRMRDSGVEWIGEVPDHWEIRRMASLFREVARPGDQSLPILSISIHDGITDDELAPEDRDRRVSQIEDRTKYKRVAPKDLAYNMMRAWQGAFGAVTVDGLVSPAYVTAEPIDDFRTVFIEHLLRTPMAIEEMRRYSRGIADFRMRLYWDYFRDLKVCLPPLDEQDEILRRTSRETGRIELLVEKTQHSIDLLKQRRSVLITAAVTGQIDLRGSV